MTPKQARQAILIERKEPALAEWEAFALERVRANEGRVAARARWRDVLGVARRMRLAVMQEARKAAREAAKGVTR